MEIKEEKDSESPGSGPKQRATLEKMRPFLMIENINPSNNSDPTIKSYMVQHHIFFISLYVKYLRSLKMLRAFLVSINVHKCCSIISVLSVFQFLFKIIPSEMEVAPHPQNS